jgi:hypothetical protein
VILGVVVAVLAGLLGVFVPAASTSPIDPAGSNVGATAKLTANGTTLRLAGVVRCATCRSFTLGVTVSQPASGAVGQGGVRCVCHGASERWLLTARAREATHFKAGPARVCVWVLARGAGNRAIDARQWCETVVLAKPSGSSAA